MPISEPALNSALADALSDHDVHATPEQTRPGTARKRCDVEIRRKHGDRYYTAVECKIGQSSIQKGAAVKDAQRWLKHTDCWNAIGVCYPEELSQDHPVTPRKRIAATDKLLMAKVNQSGVVGHWRKDDLSDLANLADDVGANETYRVTDILKQAIIAASDLIDAATAKDLADTLELPWAPPKKTGIDKRPPRIACLIVANMALLQNRMRSEGIRIEDLDTLIDIRSAGNRQTALLDNWKRIREVDYVPVVDPALAVLHKLPVDQHTNGLLEILLEGVLDCAPHIRGLQLDHAGPLYHGLLETAKYDGSYYTSTSTSVLLAELAMPPDWSCIEDHWNDTDRLMSLKICDPACGTGTLLMAAARTIEQRFRHAGGEEDDLPALHLGLIEDVLYGLDINRHAIHLAASMLTLSAPRIDYNRMHLYNMQHGVGASGEVRAGSLDILVDDATYMPGFAPPEMKQQRAGAEGYREDTPDLKGQCDLVIMNPPFTRNDIRNRHLPPKMRKKVQEHEVELAKTTPVRAHSLAIDQSTIGTFFTPIGDILLGQTGALAIVKPFTACTNASGKDERDLLTDPKRFELELVVTSHDNRRINFSENTDVHESLIIARRPTPEAKSTRRTAFVSLAENPQSASEAHFLAEAIQTALKGDNGALAAYGTISWRSIDQLRGRPWNAACFYDQSLAEAYDVLLENPALTDIGKLALVEPGGQRVRDAFKKAGKRQNPDMRALWAHKSARLTSMRTTPDEFLVAKKGRENYAAHLWQKRGNLLLANRFRLNLTHTPAVFSDESALGSAFVPVSPVGTDDEQACKAWCAWLNSTFGILAYLNLRQKNLTYPHFSLDGLRSLPVPRPGSCDLPGLATAFDQLADQALRPLPEIHSDPVRQSLDEAVIKAVPGLLEGAAPRLRRAISLEPSVTNEKEPLRLT